MRIAALYIPTGYLPYVFGKGHDELTINLGGRNLYSISNNSISDVKPNPFYLESIFEDDISLFSCIVGNNGGGKTTILKLITSSWHCLYVIENAEEEYWLTESPEEFHRIYYTPYLSNILFDSIRQNGKDLSKYSLIRTDNHGDSGILKEFLESHFSENIKRWIKFNHFYKQQEDLEVKLPTFENLTFSLSHFDLTVYQPERFHDTPYQFRGAIKLLLGKIQKEAAEEEKKALEGKNVKSKGIDKYYFPIRFKYDLYELALAKLVSIFERQGNKYLNEGDIPENFNEIIEGLDIRNGLQMFLQTTGVHSGKKKYAFSQHLVLLDLIDYILSLISGDRVTDNWRRIIINEAEATRIVELYDQFNESFNNAWFGFDEKAMFGFSPHISVSSGEQSFLNLFSTLFYHANNVKAGVDIDQHNFYSLEGIQKDILLLLDEGDNAFHPQWKKSYVKYLRKLLPRIFLGFRVQVVITSHDPLTLSDLPKNNVVFLERADGKTQISNSSTKKTFGANVADLLKDSFFIQDGQIGDFVASQIDKIIKDIKSRQISSDRKIEIEKIIYAIDEPVLKFKLAEMLSEVIGDKGFELKLIDEEIRRLERRRGLL